MRSRGAVVSLAAAAAIALAAAWWLRPAAEPAHWPAAALRGGNLLLVTIDTLRADRLTPRHMPNLARLAAASHHFRTTYAHSPLTLPSHASLFTGRLPPAHGVRGNGAFRLPDASTTLAERLRAAGYRTGAFTGAFVLDSRFGLAQGFDRYDGVDDERAFAADFGFAERRAPAVVKPAAAWILDPAAGGRPWFAWVHVFDPHAPYDAPGAGPGYDQEVAYVDRVLGEFLASLERGGALAHTAVIVTADHGESLGEHGETTHGLFTYDATMRVPLVVSGPALGAGDHQDAVSLIDVAPTVLDVLGLDGAADLPGRSVRTTRTGDAAPIYLEAMDGWLTAGAAPVEAVVDGGWKLIAAPIPELYNLAADPGETQNGAAADAERARVLRERLASLAGSAATSMSVLRDPAAEARLRSLGYASGAARRPAAAFSPDDDPKRVRPLYERFLAILSGGGTDVTGLREIVAARPGFVAARLAAASVLIETGRAAEAVALLEPAAVAPDAAVAIRERLGSAYLAAQRPDQAASVLEALVAEPVSADAWNALGVARAQLGKPAEARAAFDEAGRLAPDAARIQFNRVVARLESGDRAGAERDLSALTTRHPDFADGWKLAGTLRHEAGDRAGAVDAWRQSLRGHPDDVDVMFNLALTLRDLGRAGEAREMARRFLDRAPRPAFDREAAIMAPIARAPASR